MPSQALQQLDGDAAFEEVRPLVIQNTAVRNAVLRPGIGLRFHPFVGEGAVPVGCVLQRFPNKVHDRLLQAVDVGDAAPGRQWRWRRFWWSVISAEGNWMDAFIPAYDFVVGTQQVLVRQNLRR